MAPHLVFCRDLLAMGKGIWEEKATTAITGLALSDIGHTAHLSGVVAGLLFCLWRGLAYKTHHTSFLPFPSPPPPPLPPPPPPPPPSPRSPPLSPPPALRRSRRRKVQLLDVT